MPRKKLLVCGSAGFLMSNFIRYMLYHSKDYDFVSIDNLANMSDYKRLYIHKDHKFYLGDITDKYLMDRILFIEKPDMIVNGIGYGKIESEQSKDVKAINVAHSLSHYDIPIIQLIHNLAIDNLGAGLVISNLICWKKYNTTILLPDCFGFRQKPDSGMAFLINEIMAGRPITPSNTETSWVYAEDVASFIWFIIENNIAGNIKMPSLGKISIDNLVTTLTKILKTSDNLDEISQNEIPKVLGLPENIKDWLPDSVNLLESIKKTARWFNSNRWAL
jgi:dTDP-D-glucose 4,6-dehydratase